MTCTKGPESGSVRDDVPLPLCSQTRYPGEGCTYPEGNGSIPRLPSPVDLELLTGFVVVDKFLSLLESILSLSNKDQSQSQPLRLPWAKGDKMQSAVAGSK